MTGPKNTRPDNFLQLDDDNLEDRSYEIRAEEDCARLDVYLRGLLGSLSRSHIQRLIRGGSVLVGGEISKPSKTVRAGDNIYVTLPPLQPSDIAPEPIPLNVIYEDDDILVVDKQKGLTVHPAPNQSSGTLVNALLHHCGNRLSGINGILRPGIVHRLDKDTSGLLVVAKNDAAHNSISDQMARRKTFKKYTAVVHGVPKKSQGRIETMIGRNPRDRKKMAVVDRNGKDSITVYRVEERFAHFAVLDIDLLTGRTHQIRVHAAHIGHPVAGDAVYGGAKLKAGDLRGDARETFELALADIEGQALHARELEFRHPRTAEAVRFESPPPADVLKFIDFLRDNDAVEDEN